MNKHLSLWQKLTIKYHFHWMDSDYHYLQRVLRIPPTWFLTHTEKRAQRKQAALEAKQQKALAEREQIVQELTELLEVLQKQKGTEGAPSSSADS